MKISKANQISILCSGGECHDHGGCSGWAIVPGLGASIPCLHACHREAKQ